VSALIQQLPALIGVIIGALGSYLAVMRGDQARFRREQEARWEERRLVAYTDYALSLKTTVTLTRRVASHLGNDPHPQPLTPTEAASHLAEATDVRSSSGEALLMLGTPEVVQEAHGWAVTVSDLEHSVHTRSCTSETWSALLEQQRTARESYGAMGIPADPAHVKDWA
jgi:hypothetical protein